ncbi:Hypothetical protein A7982_09714 [Minicystis rosea]|nr:Hypothetical protein A7982_09714 [Minicystis rosea]
MARSPLFSLLSRAHLLLRGAARAGVPLDEHVAEERARRIARRRFLQASAAATLAIPFAEGCGSDPDPSGNAPTVAIVGGGMAGLHCAYRLKKAGVLATVYDANKRLGGRMFSDRSTFPDGMHCELGGELIDTGHETMRDLATELGIDLLDYATDDASLSSDVVYIGGKSLTMQEILDGYAPIAAEIDKALLTLTDQDDLFVYYDKPNGGEALDALSIKAWLDTIKAEGPVREMLEIAYNIEYGLETDVSNVLNMLFLISTNVDKLELFGASDERFHTKTGNDTFITKLAEKLDDAQIELETALTSISEAADGRYKLTLSQGSGTKEVTADHVVLALPFTILRGLDVKLDLPEAKRTAIMEQGMGTNTKLMCGFSSRPWRDTTKSNGSSYADTGYQCTWETSRLQPGESGILTNFTGGNPGLDYTKGTPEERMADFLDQIDVVYPGAKAASNGKVARMAWPTYPLTKGSYSAYLVGQYTKIAGVEIERYQNVHFCGEHTSLDAQGYMEGAALTGAMAAEELLGDIKVEAQRARVDATLVSQAADRILTRARAARADRRWHVSALRAQRQGR